MLKDNIKHLREQKGLSQEELSVKLHVVRQTISKWETGLSVPDAEMLISISEVFDTPVSTLLGEDIKLKKEDDLKIISEKLEIINKQLYQENIRKRKIKLKVLVSICIITIVLFILLFLLNSSYLKWDYSDPETSVLGAIFHSFEWAFVRIAPIILIGSITGIVLIKIKNDY